MHRYFGNKFAKTSSLDSLKKVDFFWINRDQKAFEWFYHLLTQLELEQAERWISDRNKKPKLVSLLYIAYLFL